MAFVVLLRVDIDVELLKRFTQYEGYSATDRTIKLFWKVMESFTDDERSRYVRCVVNNMIRAREAHACMRMWH